MSTAHAAESFPPYPAHPQGRVESVNVAVDARPDGTRRFTLQSTQAQRDGGPSTRVVDEAPGQPRVQSGSALFDALFAQALDDARLNSVDEIRDDAYNRGQPIPCRCFQTGEFWHYVWTRDLSYAVDLALAWLDPQRTVTSLRFKTSGWRPGVAPPAGLPAGSLQVVQDTGSGGSWPVSTDRVTWAFAAERVLQVLDSAERSAFAAHALAVLRGTVEADRLAAFDPVSGLYGGEQSFLDWRVQSYAPWITEHLARLSASRALSTNVAHLQALRLASHLAKDAGQAAEATRWAGWAEALAKAIDRVFWLDDAQQYASITSDDEQALALHKFDLLGLSLAITTGAAPPERAAQALARYPHAPFGPPVIAPQQPGVPVYHNRAQWPFVTAYALRAAARVGNTAVASAAFESLRRAAALNLSNMENLEWLTAQPRFDDGPVINSRRQLWSVAAWISAVAENVFGFQPEGEGLRIAPFLTTAARRALGDAPTATLQGLRLRGRTVDIVLHLPPLPSLPPADAPVARYPVAQLRLNGEPVPALLPLSALPQGRTHRIEVSFAAPVAGDARITHAPTVDPLDRTDPRVVAPDVPQQLRLLREPAGVRLQFTPPRHRGTLRYDIVRDGQRIASGLDAPQWLDTTARPGLAHTYAVQAVDVAHGHRSHLSEPARLEDGGALQRAAPDGWFTRTQPGRVGLELLYANTTHETQTGVTNAVKWLRVLDEQGREVARGVVQMPHTEPHNGQRPMRASTQLRATLPAGRYRLVLSDFFNMSDLASNASYSGPGGASGRLNQADVDALLVWTLPDLP